MTTETEFDWTDRLIEAVKARPVIYNKNLKENADKNGIVRAWLEVCEIMIESWDDLTLSEKQLKGKELQQKWRNLRTCFLRELSKQKQTKTKQAGLKRRKYIYYDQLLFLLSTATDTEIAIETKPLQNNSKKISSEAKPHSIRESNPVNRHQINNKTESIRKSKLTAENLQNSNKDSKGNIKKRKISIEDTILEILKEKPSKKIDEDKYFLLSLVPSFQKMTDEQKINAKIQILSIIKNINEKSEIAILNNPIQNTENNMPIIDDNSYSDNSSQSWIKKSDYAPNSPPYT